MDALIYHLVTRGIEAKILFPEQKFYEHFLTLVNFYRRDMPIRFSLFARHSKDSQQNMILQAPEILKILAYCLMPNHIHLIVEAIEENILTKFTKRLLDSYTRYYNERNNRKGTLYQNTIKKILVSTDEYLLHLTRYIHLNPYSAGLVKKTEDWEYSSYREYLGLKADIDRLCEFSRYLKIEPDQYKKFVEDRKDYQRSLEILKSDLKMLGLL